MPLRRREPSGESAELAPDAYWPGNKPTLPHLDALAADPNDIPSCEKQVVWYVRIRGAAAESVTPRLRIGRSGHPCTCGKIPVGKIVARTVEAVLAMWILRDAAVRFHNTGNRDAAFDSVIFVAVLLAAIGGFDVANSTTRSLGEKDMACIRP